MEAREIDSRYSYGRIWKIAYPILISLVMEQMIGMTDTAFLGRVGEIEIGASALAGVYYMVIFMLGLGFSIGVQIIIGRRNGEGHYRQAGEVFWHGLYFLLALAVVITAASEWLSPKIMGLIISSDNIYNASLSYVRWRVMGLVFGFSTAMFRSFYIGTTQTKALSINSLVMLMSNILFNWVLIFGKFGFPTLGIAGAAIGSTLAELVSLIFFIVYTSKRCETFKGILGHNEVNILGFRLDYGSEFPFHLHLVHLFPVYRTHRRESPCRIQYNKEYLRPDMDGPYGFCIHVQYACEQCHR